MTIEVRSQHIARAAFDAVDRRSNESDREKYLGFARSFPTLIHTSGLAQAVAFALAKGVKQKEKRDLIDDLCTVLHESGCGWLADGQERNGSALDERARSETTVVAKYMTLTRHAIKSATWIKRYAEALLSPTTGPNSNSDPLKNNGSESPATAKVIT